MRITSTVALLTICLAAVNAPASANQTAIDFNNGPGLGFTSPGSGQYFALGDSHSLNLSGNGSSGAIDLGFNVTIGGNTYTSIFINENGLVSFNDALPGGSFLAASSVSDLATKFAQPFIAASYANLQTTGAAAVDNFNSGSASGVMYQVGQADPLGGSNDSGGHVPPNDPTSLPKAFSIIWSDPSQSGGFMSQLVLYSLNNATGDFAIRFRYGSAAFGDNPDIGAFAGYSLGANSLNFTRLNSATDIYFASPAGVAAPEPATLTLLGAALLGLAVLRSPRRSRGALQWRALA